MEKFIIKSNRLQEGGTVFAAKIIFQNFASYILKLFQADLYCFYLGQFVAIHFRPAQLHVLTGFFCCLFFKTLPSLLLLMLPVSICKTYSKIVTALF